MNNPIGVFDSGVGGLTVLDALIKKLPFEDFIYLGDTANLPYGNKTPETVLQYARKNSNFLLEKKIKLLVIACHTASCHAEHILRQELSIPVIGVTNVGCELILKSTRSKKIAILGTSSTISSETIQNAITSQDPTISIFAKACPLFVPLVEDGLHDHPSAELIAHHYLNFLNEEEIDSVLLACTHYPLLKTTLSKVLGTKIKLVEPSIEVANLVAHTLFEQNLLKKDRTSSSLQFYCTENPEKFRNMASIFLKDYKISSVQLMTPYQVHDLSSNPL